MGIKIPRADIPIPSLPNQRSNMLTEAKNSKIQYSNLTDTVNEIGKTIQFYNKEVETQRKKNKNDTNKALLTGDINSLLEDINNDPDLATNGTENSFNGVYDATIKQLENKYNNLYKDDADAYADFKPLFYNLSIEGRGKMRKQRRKKIMALGEANFDIETEAGNEYLDNLIVNSNIYKVAEEFKRQEKERYVNAVYLGVSKDKANYKNRIEYIDFTIAKKVVSEGLLYTDPVTGITEVDYLKVWNRINNAKEKPIFGKKLIKDQKNKLLEWARIKSDNQKSIRKDTHARVDNNNTPEIDKLIIRFQNGEKLGPYDQTSKDFILNKINTTSLTKDTKKTLRGQLNLADPSGTGGDPTGSPAALNYYFDQIILGKAKDKKFIQEVHQDTRLTVKGKKEILNWAKDFNQENSKYAEEQIKSFLGQFGFVSRLDKLTPHTFNPAQHQIKTALMRVLAEGEKAGISYHSMLMDTESEYYLGYKFMDVYAESIIQQSTITGQDAQKYWQTKNREIYKTFFDADPNTPGNQAVSKHGLENIEVDEKGNVIMQERELEIDTSQTIFLNRLRAKPEPPKLKRTNKGKYIEGVISPDSRWETVGEYMLSNEHKKYQADFKDWVEQGGFNSSDISLIDQLFGSADFLTTPKKNYDKIGEE